MNPGAIGILMIAGILCTIPEDVSAQNCGFSSGKSLHELQFSLESTPPLVPYHPLFKNISSESNQSISKIFLPRWSAAELPFFCKMEYSWTKVHGRTPVKFRLGSVDYVDWLEGKSLDKTRF